MTTRTLSPGSSSSSQTYIKNSGLGKLCSLLRNEGDKVLSGTSTFTLTAEVLAQLNTDCRRHSITENDINTSEIVAKDRSFVSLTSSLRAQQEANKSKAEWSNHIQFIKDFMLSTPCLKLIRYSGSLSSPISLQRFGNLSTLNLRKVPIHMVEGLHKLRETLISITVYRGVDKVKDLLEFCGGDMTSPATWPQLKFVSFMFNSISALDDSLRLLPKIEVFDLSHNSLETCDNFLEYLGDAQRLILAYNSLTCVPSVSISTRASLTCLILRGNDLDNIKGLELLTALQELDLGENCISEHSLLQPLGNLTELKKLQLDGNPACYHKSHRSLTVSRLSFQAANVEFVLDKRKLTVSEISKADLKRTPYPSSQDAGRATAQIPSVDYEPSPSSGIGTGNESVDSAVSFKHKKKSKHKRLRARTTVIMDLENSGEFSSGDGTPGTSPHARNLEQHLRSKREEARKTQSEIEELRKHYGPNWLQAIEDRDIFKRNKALAVPKLESSESETENTDQEDSNRKKFFIGSKSSGSLDDIIKNNPTPGDSENEFKRNVSPTEDDLYLTDTRMSDTTNPIMASIARMAAGYSTDDTDGGNRLSTSFNPTPFNAHSELFVENKLETPVASTHESSDVDSTTHASPSPTLGVAGIKDKINASSQIFSEANFEKPNQNYFHAATSTSGNSNQSSDKMVANENNTSLSKQPVSLFESEGDETSTKKSPNSDLKSLMPASPDKTESETSPCSPTALLETEEVTESMFASLPLQDNEIIIVALTAFYLVEKDVGGKVMEKLELASLTELKWEKVKKGSDGNVQKGDQDEGLENKRGSAQVAADRSNSKKMMEGEAEYDKTDQIQFDMRFDYVRKDRQSRCYVMDYADGKIILDHLQPFLDYREEQEKAQLMIAMQCLKCNKTFMKSELISKQNQLPKTGSSKDLQSVKDLLNKAAQVCPKCGSALIIELEPSSTPVGSYTSSTGSYINQAKKGARFGKKNAKKAKNSQQRAPGLTTGVDRNGRFVAQPRMIKSAINISKEQQMSADEQLACIEDHFSADAMATIQTTSLTDDMTASLHGDSSSRGSTATLKRKSLKKSQSGASIDKYDAQTNHIKQNYRENTDKLGSEVINDVNRSSGPISIEGRLSRIEGIKLNDDGNSGTPSERASVYRNLTAMEDIVNSLVSEGHNLEEQENIGTSSYSSNKAKSISISAFKRSSVSHIRKVSVSSVEGLKHSESSSSIAVIPMLTPATNDGTASSVPPLSSSVPAAFSERVGVGQGTSEENAPKVGNTAVSSLSSSICSSMVSSVYETSVNNPERNMDANYPGLDVDGGGLNVTDNTDDIESAIRDTIMVIGSSSSSSEDLTSIYDHPRQPNLSVRKKPHSIVKSLSSSSDVPVTINGISASNVPGITVDSTRISPETAPQEPTLTNGTQAVVAAPNAGVDKGNNDSRESDSEEENDEELVPEYAFHHLNHRLTLYMMMSLFGPDEEFVCKLQGEVVQYIIQKSYEGILVMSTLRFYVLKITSEDHSLTPDRWLQCVEIQPIPELRYIDVGLGRQSLRLEFVTDCSSYTFITRNRDKTMQFVDMLHTNLAKYAVSQGITSHVEVNEDADSLTLSNLDREVVSKITPDQKLLHYCMGFIERGNQKRFPICFVTTSYDVCLVCTNHQWPQPRLQAPITEETVGKQFTVLERQRISNVASVEVCEATMKKLRLELFNESEGVSTSWNITFATRQSTVDFINAISEPWAKEFGVEMDIVYAELSF